MTRAESSGPTLRELLGSAQITASRGDLDVVVGAVRHDSRLVESGDVFFALDGARLRGLDYAPQARRAGAAAIVASELVDDDGTGVAVADVRRVMARAACVATGHPTGKIPTVGITGTNGKTTTTYLLEAAYRAAGKKAGVIGTIDVRLGEERREVAGFTTPEAPELQRLAADLVKDGAEALFLEVTSHGIKLARTHGTQFKVVAFSNLTQDHLDLHGSMEDYGLTKMRLFNEELAFSESPVAVVNIDDPFGERVAQSASCPVVTVSSLGREDADIRVAQQGLSERGVEVVIERGRRRLELSCPLIGAHNVANLTLAFGICDELGLPWEHIAAGFAGLPRVPGRVEPVPDPRGSLVLVDYAHTPDALERVSEALAAFTKGRLFVVFGCGGDRDTTKRPKMGAAAARHADLVVVTSDNPRTEEPAAIVEMALPGVWQSDLQEIAIDELAEAARGYAVEVDRRKAIHAAVGAAGPEDVVLIAGKGHEDYQILGREKIHFDDREEAAAAIAAATAQGEG